MSPRFSSSEGWQDGYAPVMGTGVLGLESDPSHEAQDSDLDSSQRARDSDLTRTWDLLDSSLGLVKGRLTLLIQLDIRRLLNSVYLLFEINCRLLSFRI